MAYGTQHVLYYSGHMVRRSTGRDVRLSGRMAYGLRDGIRPAYPQDVIKTCPAYPQDMMYLEYQKIR